MKGRCEETSKFSLRHHPELDQRYSPKDQRTNHLTASTLGRSCLYTTGVKTLQGTGYLKYQTKAAPQVLKRGGALEFNNLIPFSKAILGRWDFVVYGTDELPDSKNHLEPLTIHHGQKLQTKVLVKNSEESLPLGSEEIMDSLTERQEGKK